MSELKIFSLSNEGSVLADPASCSGNACSVITLSSIFHSGTLMVKTINVTNSGTKAVKVKLTWGGAFNPCNSDSEAIVQPNQSVGLHSPNEYVAGYCSMTANYQ